MADPAAAQSHREHANIDPERSAGIAHRSDHHSHDGRDRRRVRGSGLQHRGGGDLRAAVAARRILLVQCRPQRLLRRPA
jgi:hypothetical protein